MALSVVGMEPISCHIMGTLGEIPRFYEVGSSDDDFPRLARGFCSRVDNHTPCENC